jgi:Phage integrase, N-terminal SAM-like domain
VPKHEGVYRDAKGWYFKARVSQDVLTGKWTQATRRGFASAVDASTARRELLEGNQAVVVGSGSMSVNELMKLYFEDAESSSALSTKTLFDYRNYADVYVSPYLGGRAIRDITPEMIARWQQKLTKGGAIRSRCRRTACASLVLLWPARSSTRFVLVIFARVRWKMCPAQSNVDQSLGTGRQNKRVNS